MSSTDVGIDDFLAATANGGSPIALRPVGPRTRTPRTDLVGLAVRRIDGRDARTLPSLYRTMAATWDFPAHFGMNKDAFDDCMGDLPDTRRGYLTEITHPAALLDESGGELSWFVDSLSFYAEEYAPDLQFGVLLLTEVDAVSTTAARWSAAGADLVAVR